MNLVLAVVPIQCYPDVPFSCPIARKFVVFFVCVLELLCMFFANAFHAKVIKNRCALYWSTVVFPKAMYRLSSSLSVFVDMFFEEFVGQ